MLWHIWLLNAYIDFISGYVGQPCTLLTYFCSFNFQLSTNKVAFVIVVVVLYFSLQSKSEQVDILQMLTFSTCYFN